MAQLKRIAGANQPAATLDRRQAVPALIERPADWLVVAGLARRNLDGRMTAKVDPEDVVQ